MRSKELLLSIQLTNRCVNKCKHCGGNFGECKNKSIDIKDLKDIIAQFGSIYEKGSINVSGGEPTLYEQLPEIIRYINQNSPFHCTGIVTNGVKIARKKNYVSELKKAGLNSIISTLFGLKETHDWFSQRKGSFEDIIKSSQAALENGMNTRWTVMVHKKNKDELEDVIKLAENLGVKLGYFCSFGLFGRAKKYAHLRLSPEEKRIVLEKYGDNAEPLRCYDEKTLAKMAKGVCYPLDPNIDFFEMDFNMNVYSCPFQEEDENYKIGNLKTEKIEALVDKQSVAVKLIKEIGFENIARVKNSEKKYCMIHEGCELCHRWIKEYLETKTSDYNFNQYLF